ncbi:unannotated protein [freshwater metagenome]|uniref:Unannotated protein n=1 Tax=freshwater metagenome TaxID=449393 RepID=A0A6J6IZV8_9ZZZZ
MEEPINLCLDHGRAVTRASVFLNFFHRKVNRERVHAVHPPAGNSKPRAATRKTFLCGDFRNVRGHRVKVVLDKEDKWNIPRGSEVHGFENGTNVDSTITKVTHR